MRLTEAMALKNGKNLAEYTFTHLTEDEVKEIKSLRRKKKEDEGLFPWPKHIPILKTNTR